ncbi:hypothetical protein [Flavobacterium sp.]|uniref:hypothetical protein n=1 Tax=Flavobacterium sp. TaxID=239 RepID=UPI00391AC8D4
MIIIVSKYLIPKGFRGLTLFPFVFLKYSASRSDSTLINHEKIHLRQQLELLIFPFFVWYILEFLLKLLRYRNRNKAYMAISFEREAYQNEKSTTYLSERAWFSFWKFL